METALLILGYIDKLGPLVVALVIKMFTQPGGPTAADWVALDKLTSIRARDQMLTTLAAHGIDPASPAGQAFLALTPA
jgi:hypothetical protein